MAQAKETYQYELKTHYVPDTLLTRELLLRTVAREIHKFSGVQGDCRTWTIIGAKMKRQRDKKTIASRQRGNTLNENISSRIQYWLQNLIFE